MTTHTPEPWTYRPGDGIFDAAGRRIVALSYGGKQISMKVSDEELAANARLIAAAPELLAELQRYVDYYSGAKVAQLGTGEAFQHWDRARALLAEIDGEENSGHTHTCTSCGKDWTCTEDEDDCDLTCPYCPTGTSVEG